MQKILIAIILFAVCSINGQTSDKEKITELNREVVKLHNGGNLDEALKVAQKSLDLTLKTYGFESSETHLAYTNLGTLQREKGKYSDAVKNLQLSLDIYQKLPNPKNEKLIEMYQGLGFSQYLAGKKTEAETSYLMAVKISENAFEKESKETFQPILNVASLYARLGNFAKADEYYLQSYVIAKKNFGNESKEVEKVADARICTSKDIDKKRDELFYNEFRRIFNIEKESNPSNVINGKALNLVKPRYPEEAKKNRLSGTIKIRVEINEQGNVTEAKAVCGNGVLENASEQAALLSKFSPTFLSGVAVKVSGLIVYNFTAQ